MSRSYCITSFKEGYHFDTTHKDIRYVIMGKEICPTTGKEHWQGYVELHRTIRVAALKKIFDDKAMHVEKRKGSRDQAREYCMKEGNYTEFGTWIKGQGHRSDLDEIAERLVSGVSKIENIMEENPTIYCKYRNGLKDLAGLGMKKKTQEFREIKVSVLSGPTGIGKTRKAVETCENYFKIEGSGLQWWDGYSGEETLIIDEYDNDVGVTKLLNILDGYQLRLNTKGSFTYANWTNVIITTNLTKEQIHSQAKKAHREALFRRITDWQDLWEDTKCI